MKVARLPGGVTLVMTARVPMAGVARFQAYESLVLPLLADHGGDLQRRLRNADGTIEVQIVRFPSADRLARFRADPRRIAAAPLLTASAAVIEVFEAMDVDAD